MVIAASLLLATMIVAGMSAHAPAWYVVPDIAEERHQSVRDDIERMADQFSTALLNDTPFAIEFSDQQLNAWISLRHRIWPAVDQMIPEPWRDPIVCFEEGRVSLAARYGGGVAEPVISVEASGEIADDDLIVRITGCRIGSLRLPLRWLRPWTDVLESSLNDSSSHVPIHGSIADGLRVSCRQTWWNGKRDFRVRRVHVEPGIIRFEIEPLGRHVLPLIPRRASAQ